MMTKKTGVEPVDPVREERTGKVREVGSQAIWSLSSCKPGISETELIFRFQLSFSS
jgi:anaphase-promoting complex subunit 10